MGGAGKIVEADETFIVNKKGFPKRVGVGHKMAVMSLLERGGSVRSTVDTVTREGVERIIRRNVHEDSRLMTDTAGYYRGRRFGIAEHEMVTTTRRICLRRRACELARRLLLDFQTRHERRLSALQLEAPAPLRC